MGVIVRTAGSERSKAEIKRDFEYLMRLWDEIRELTLKSTAPALIYEEGNLIKRSIRDLYTRDIDEVMVEGEEGYRTAKAFMRMLMPSHAKRVQPYRDPTVPLFHRYQVESQLDAIHSPVVQLRSGGYIVINQTEALVAIDVNSGRATRERNIEETALKTNLEAADEIARQLRLRDLAGLIVIDFIDMEEHRNQATVERRAEGGDAERPGAHPGRPHQPLRPAGAVAPAAAAVAARGLDPALPALQRHRPYPLDRIDGAARAARHRGGRDAAALGRDHRRGADGGRALHPQPEAPGAGPDELRYGFRVAIGSDDSLVPPAFRLERLRALTPAEIAALPVPVAAVPEPEDDDDDIIDEEDEAEAEARGGEPSPRPKHKKRRATAAGKHDPSVPKARMVMAVVGVAAGAAAVVGTKPRKARCPRRRLRRSPPHPKPRLRRRRRCAQAEEAQNDEPRSDAPNSGDQGGDSAGRKRRRRGRRGGRRRRRGEPGQESLGDQPMPMTGDATPIAEIVEYMPPAAARDDDAAVEMAEALNASPAPATQLESGAESVPVAERGDYAAEPSRPAEPPSASSPAPEGGSPPANPKRGWWRRVIDS